MKFTRKKKSALLVYKLFVIYQQLLSYQLLNNVNVLFYSENKAL